MKVLKSNVIGKHEKIKTHFARIVVEGTAEEPYYSILYYDPIVGEFMDGFGSYDLGNVFKWMGETFEIVGNAFTNVPYIRELKERSYVDEAKLEAKLADEIMLRLMATSDQVEYGGDA